ncbi:MAG: SDR family oxidoreductase [Actinomycetota bacterium]|nr:SDR family oxidoreductase [Actinomycetota bacterium]
MVDSPKVVVTAGASGIGAAVAQRFLSGGARVHVCDVDDAALARVSRESPQLGVTRVDVASEGEVDGWLSRVLDDWGGIDVLVNNAGIAGPTADVEDITLDEWQRCLAVGLDSQFLTCRRVAPVMKEQRSGSIVNISSTAGLVGYGRRSPYAAAKWAVIGLTKSLAIELGPYDVRVNAVCPGSVAGDRMRRVVAAQASASGRAPADIEAEYTQAQSIARFVEPTEIADMCVFLASPEARMVSGQVIAVDGHTETYHLG